MTADNALAAKAAAGGAAGRPPRSNRKLTSKASPTNSELPDIQNRTLTNNANKTSSKIGDIGKVFSQSNCHSFNSARRKDTRESISELDLSSVKHADGGDLRKTSKRSSLPKHKV